MLPFEFLDMVDGLSRLDPLRTYPERAGEVLARLTGAEGYVLEQEGGETIASKDLNRELPRVALPLRYGSQTLGQLLLFLPASKERLDPHESRTARWGARIVARCLSYAARMRQDSRRSNLGVVDALHKAPLTPRERDVVGLLVSGASTRQIASEIHLTVGTVHTYLKRIYPKMGVRSRVELVARMIGTERRPLMAQAAASSGVH